MGFGESKCVVIFIHFSSGKPNPMIIFFVVIGEKNGDKHLMHSMPNTKVVTCNH